jgi:lysophospholipase L1-like esterase
MSLALKLALAPLLVAQAVVTRRRAPVLPEADGERAGATGRAPTWTLLIAGDSSAAGVGVAHQRHAFAGHLLRTLGAGGQALRWQLRARSGLTTRQLHDWLRAEPPETADVAVILTGVNDVIEQVSTTRAIAQREALAGWLRERGTQHVAFTPLPPIEHFPLLPQPLRRVLGADAQAHNRAIGRWVAGRSDVSLVPIPMDRLGPDMMAPDGFHPGEPVYRHCGEATARHLTQRVLQELAICH